MFKFSYHLATVFGIPIRLNITLVLLAIYLGARMGHLLLGLLVGALLVFSVVLHELGHSLVAQRAGIRVRGINMLFFGGMAIMDRMPRQPRVELRLAAAGPAVSLALGLSSAFLLWISGILTGFHPAPLAILAALNIGLAIFNLVPAFPMDGGRILRALLTRRLGRLGATFVAVRIGKILALVLGLTGLFHGNLLLVAIAVFVFFAGEREYQAVRIQEMTSGIIDGVEETEPLFDIRPQVTVSPPPYGTGRERRTPLKHLDND